VEGQGFEVQAAGTLAHPTTCSLVVLVGGGYRMEIRKGLVYPNSARLDDVPVDNASFAMVKVDMVHEKAKNLKLKVPPGDTMLTLLDAITRRV
jgi:hypothetical protein